MPFSTQASQSVTNAAGSQVDGHSATLGTTADASTATTVVGLLKKLIVVLSDTNLNATTTQGPGSGSAATFWYSRITDGTNTMPTMDNAARSGYQRVTDGTNTAAVKAASTAAAASDPSMVVAVSPNSPATVAQATPANLKATTFPGGSSSYNTNGVNETRTVRTGAGVLRGLIINPGTSSTFVVYDNTAGSGTVLVALTTGGVSGGNGYFIDCFDVAFSTGLTYVSTGGCNVTLVYYF